MVNFFIPEWLEQEVEQLTQEDEQRLKAEIQLFKNGLIKKGDYSSPYSFLQLSSDDKNLFEVERQAAAVKADVVVLIGIGGSSLGTEAVYSALQSSGACFILVNSVDTDYLSDLLINLRGIVCENKRLHIVIVSKSGTTLETSVNSSFIIDLLARANTPSPLKPSMITVITDKGSLLWDWAKTEDIGLLEVPKLVGGRYSVFSSVGLYPLALLGIDIGSLLRGAEDAIINALVNDDENIALKSAKLLFAAHKKGIFIHDTFLFDRRFEAVGKWYRQLMAESLGKRYDREGKLVETGMLPTVSMGSVDLHSMAQLYLGGPRKFITSFVYVKPEAQAEDDVYLFPLSTPIHPISVLKKEVRLEAIQRALFDSVVQTYDKERRWYLKWELEKKAYDLGFFMQTKMLEIVYLSALLNVNPFDQPEVELYKKETRTLLQL